MSDSSNVPEAKIGKAKVIEILDKFCKFNCYITQPFFLIWSFECGCRYFYILINFRIKSGFFETEKVVKIIEDS
jgi:hypothetical protein